MKYRLKQFDYENDVAAERDICDKFCQLKSMNERMRPDLYRRVADALKQDYLACDTPEQREKLRDKFRKLALEIEGNSTKPLAPNRGKKVNARMLDKMLKDAMCKGWTCSEWAKFLKCSTASVVNAPAWQKLRDFREGLKIDRRKDRHRRAKGSDQRRVRDDD